MDRPDIISAVHQYAREHLLTEFVPGKTYIPPAAPDLRADDVATIAEALLQFWYTEWKFCRRFERAISTITGKPHVVLTNSGSSASLVAISAAVMRYDPGHNGKYIITCATGFPTTVSPIYQVGYTPLYIDIQDDLTPNMEQLELALQEFGQDVVGAVFAHTLGMSYDEHRVKSLLGEHRFLVSDCCDALGAQVHGLPVGHFADFATLSFFPSHHVMAGEGGAVFTSDPDHAALVTSLTNWGRSCYCRPGENNTCGKRFTWEDRGNLPEGWDHKYIFSHLGYNLKMTEFQGALGYSQILRLDEMVARRRSNYDYLFREINRKEYRAHLQLIDLPESASPFGFPILVTSDAFTLNEFVAYLENHKVGTRRLFGGNLIRQPAFMNRLYLKAIDVSISDRLMNGMIWISVSPTLDTSMLNYMVYVIEQFFIERELV